VPHHYASRRITTHRYASLRISTHRYASLTCWQLSRTSRNSDVPQDLELRVQSTTARQRFAATIAAARRFQPSESTLDHRPHQRHRVSVVITRAHISTRVPTRANLTPLCRSSPTRTRAHAHLHVPAPVAHIHAPAAPVHALTAHRHASTAHRRALTAHTVARRPHTLAHRSHPSRASRTPPRTDRTPSCAIRTRSGASRTPPRADCTRPRAERTRPRAHRVPSRAAHTRRALTVHRLAPIAPVRTNLPSPFVSTSAHNCASHQSSGDTATHLARDIQHAARSRTRSRCSPSPPRSLRPRPSVAPARRSRLATPLQHGQPVPSCHVAPCHCALSFRVLAFSGGEMIPI
jgi:hypothetical protein